MSFLAQLSIFFEEFDYSNSTNKILFFTSFYSFYLIRINLHRFANKTQRSEFTYHLPLRNGIDRYGDKEEY